MFSKKSLFLFKFEGLGRIMAGLVMALAILTIGATAQAAEITITNQSGSVVYTDLGNGQNSVYLVFQISSNSPVADAWIELVTGAGSIQNVGTGVHQLKFKPGAGTADPIAQTGLVTGEAKGVLFLVKASAATGTPQTLTVNVRNSNGGSILGTDTFDFTVEDTIKANANKVNTVVTIPDNPTIGQLGKITVTGCTGTVGAQNVLYFSPVSANTWPADAFEFIDAVVVITGYPGTPYKNIAKIPTADVAANTSDHCYTETFTFVITDEGNAVTTPSNYVASGQPIKHTVNDSGSFQVIIPPAECPPIDVTSTPLTLHDGAAGFAYGTVQFSASGGTGPYTFEASSGAIPSGMTLSSDGKLSGTPTEGGTFNFTVTATDTNGDPSGCTGQTTRSLTIDCPTLTVSPTSLTDGTINVAYGPVQFIASGGSGSYLYEVTSGDLPAGMTFSSGGELGGTPTEYGTFIFTVGAVDNDTTCPVLNPLALTLTINCPTITVPLSGVTAFIDGSSTVITATPSGGTSPYTYDWSASTASGSASGNTFTADGTGSVSVTATDAHECQGSASVNVTEKSESIPTLSEWGMIIFSLLLAGSAIWVMRQRRNEI